MKVKELKNYLKDFNDDVEIAIVDFEQSNCWNIAELRTCEDRTSNDYMKFIDVVIEGM